MKWLLSILLLPFACLYQLVTDIRNWLYNKGYKPSTQFPLPVISVGNLTVGGTGKTPQVAYLLKKLASRYHTVTLSRGYGRTTTGFRWARADSTAQSIGDEPFQLYQAFNHQIEVSVCERRVEGMNRILEEKPDTQLVILDDAFQHRPLRPSFSILLTDFNRLFYQDWLLPLGRLRESRKGARRADCVIVTKVPPALSQDHQQKITAAIHRYAQVSVFFTCLKYLKPTGESDWPGDEVLLVSGIARPEPLEAYVRSHYTLVQHLRYADHHTYSASDLSRIRQVFYNSEARAVLTTEKDWVKLQVLAKDLPVFYLPIETCFLEKEDQFLALLEKNMQAFSKEL
jgi:tetraacyldisaccharide 4'-kinase